MLPLVVVISQVPPVMVWGTWTLPLAVSVRKTLSEPETLPLVERTVRVLGVVCSFYRFGKHCLSFRSPTRGHNKHELGMSLFP